MRKLLLTTFIFFSTTFLLFAQVEKAKSDSINFEQLALNYFSDSILHKKVPFLKTQAYFSGKVDSSITPLYFSCVAEKQFNIRRDNEELLEYINKEYELARTKDFSKKNKKAQFNINVKKPIRTRYKKAFASKKYSRTIRIYQNRKVGNKNFVWLRLLNRSDVLGEDIFITMDKSGKVLDWCFYTFIF